MLVLTVIISFFAVYFCEKPLIPVLRRLKVGNTEREELESHQKKTGTPSMGGLGILIGVFVACAAAILLMGIDADQITDLFIVFGLVTLYGLTGFLDDFLKAKKHKSDGLKAWQKMLLLFAVTVLLLIFLINKDPSLITCVRFPFIGRTIHLGWLGYVVFFLAVLGTINGVNLTDGVDGLVSSVTVPVAVFFAVVSITTGNTVVSIFCAAMGGALMGFLMHNSNPAKIFMGDTGSLALGGFVIICAYLTGTIVFVLIVGLIYWVEVLSVMMQVTYFKLTHGRRIFRMAPIHHHFELSGMSETQVVNSFAVVTVLLVLIGLWGYFG